MREKLRERVNNGRDGAAGGEATATAPATTGPTPARPTSDSQQD